MRDRMTEQICRDAGEILRCVEELLAKIAERHDTAPLAEARRAISDAVVRTETNAADALWFVGPNGKMCRAEKIS